MQPTPQQTAEFFKGVHPIYRTVNKQDEQDPTARLIAAAPELLEALREILALAEEGVIQRNETGKPQWNLTTALTEISRSAILKATGK